MSYEYITRMCSVLFKPLSFCNREELVVLDSLDCTQLDVEQQVVLGKPDS